MKCGDYQNHVILGRFHDLERRGTQQPAASAEWGLLSWTFLRGEEQGWPEGCGRLSVSLSSNLPFFTCAETF